MRATVETHPDTNHFPPIHATIVAGEHDVGIRISDQGSLISPDPAIASLPLPYPASSSFPSHSYPSPFLHLISSLYLIPSSVPSSPSPVPSAERVAILLLHGVVFALFALMFDSGTP